jgi:hypothetical protein
MGPAGHNACWSFFVDTLHGCGMRRGRIERSFSLIAPTPMSIRRFFEAAKRCLFAALNQRPLPPDKPL